MFWSKLREIDKRYPSSSIGTLISIVFGVIGLWLALGYERNPQLRYEIVSLSPVYSIREDVPELVITFNGQNIRQQRLALSVLTMRISNPGSADIPLTSFDNRDLPGFELNSGKIIQLDVIEKSRQSMDKTLEVTRTSEKAFSINPIILGRNQFFVVKMLVLSDESTALDVVPFGDVGGVGRIEMVKPRPAEDQGSLFWRAFGGNWRLQIIRGFGYMFVTLAAIILLASGIGSVISRLRRRHRRHLVKKFRRLMDHEPTKKETAIFDRYVQAGEGAIVQLNQAFSDRSTLAKHVSEYMAFLDPKKPKTPTEFRVDFMPEELQPWHHRFVPMLIEQKVIAVKENEVSVDEQTAQTLGRFESFLLANEPDKIQTAKAPFGSDEQPTEDVAEQPATKNPENE